MNWQGNHSVFTFDVINDIAVKYHWDAIRQKIKLGMQFVCSNNNCTTVQFLLSLRTHVILFAVITNHALPHRLIS